MKVLILGDFSGNGDEGLSQVSTRIYELLKNNFEVKCTNTKEFYRIGTFFKILKYKPQIVHYITGPTLKSFIILFLIKTLLLGKTKTVISATRSFIPTKYFFLLNFLYVDLVLTQSSKWENIFRRYNLECRFIPNAVDTEKFRRSELSKSELKLKYGIPVDKKILLHIGHIRKNRNLKFFIDIAEESEKLGFKIVIVSSSHFVKDESLYSDLIKAGIIVKTEYYPNISEIYSLADYYVFPVQGLGKGYFPKSLEEVGVIDMPLSILEALCVGIPIISTEVDSIHNLFSKINLECPVRFWNGSVYEFLAILKERIQIEEFCEDMKQLIDEKKFKLDLFENYQTLINR